jgi:CspA family cold shock protein
MTQETVQASGRVKFFDQAKGFGFIVCDGIVGDVMVHRSVLMRHKLKFLPEGALVDVLAFRGPRGMQTAEVLSYDLDCAPPISRTPRSCADPVTARKHGEPGPFETLTVKWFHGLKGYGFLQRGEEDVFFHAATLHAAGIKEVWPGDLVEARVATSERGLIAVEVRQSEAESIAA